LPVEEIVLAVLAGDARGDKAIMGVRVEGVLEIRIPT